MRKDRVSYPSGLVDCPALTTQLYFPDEAASASDQTYDPQMLLTIEKTTTDGETAFKFVINTWNVVELARTLKEIAEARTD